MVKNLLAVRETRVQSLVGKIPWKRKWQPTPVFLPGKFHGQRGLVGYSPWGHKESDMTEWLPHWPVQDFRFFHAQFGSFSSLLRFVPLFVQSCVLVVRRGCLGWDRPFTAELACGRQVWRAFPELSRRRVSQEPQAKIRLGAQGAGGLGCSQLHVLLYSRCSESLLCRM